MWERWLKQLSVSVVAFAFGTGLIGMSQCSGAEECRDCSGMVSDIQLYPRLDRSAAYYSSQYVSRGAPYENIVIRDRSTLFDTVGAESYNTTFAQPPVAPSAIVVRNWGDPFAPDYSPGTAQRSANPDWRVGGNEQSLPTSCGSCETYTNTRNADQITTRSQIRMAPGTMSGSAYPYVEQKERPYSAGIESPNVGTGNPATPVINTGPIEGETMGARGEGPETTGQIETYSTSRTATGATGVGGDTSDKRGAEGSALNAARNGATGAQITGGRGMPSASGGAVDTTGRAPGTINTSAGWTRTEGSNPSGTTPGGVINGQQVAPQQ